MFLALICALSTGAAPRPVICIDPGHPSEVGRGAHGRKATEIHVAFRIAQLLSQTLTKDGYAVVLTKHREAERVTNRRRAEIANKAGAALFLRLHCDASNGTGSAKGPSPEVITASQVAAKPFYAAMQASLAGVFAAEGLKTDRQTAVGSKQGALTGSIFAKVPTLLVEMVVLTNPKDEDWILSRDGETAMVKALEAGVRAAVPLQPATPAAP